MPLSQSHTHTRVGGVQVPYRGFSNEADQWVLSTDTRPLTTAQHGVGNVCVCACVCMCVCGWVQGQQAELYHSSLPALYHPTTFQSHDLHFHPQTCLFLCVLPLIHV